MAKNIWHGPLVDSQILLGLCIAVLKPPHPLTCATRWHTDSWLHRSIKVGYWQMGRNQEDIASADGLKTLCMDPRWMAGQLDTAGKVNGHGRIVSYSWLRGCDFGKNPGLKTPHYHVVEAKATAQ